MNISAEEVNKLAHLARLQLSPEAGAQMQQDLTRIIDWMEKLNQLDTEGVEPLIHLSAELNVLREDVAGQPLPHDAALVNAPRKDSDYFRVPKVVEY